MANKTIGQLTNAAASSVTLDKQKTIVPIFQATSTENLTDGTTYNANFEQIIDDFNLVQNSSSSSSDISFEANGNILLEATQISGEAGDGQKISFITPGGTVSNYDSNLILEDSRATLSITDNQTSNEVSRIRVDDTGINIFGSTVSINGLKTPSNNTDAANKKYVDDEIDDLPFWTLSEINTFKGRYYFELNASSWYGSGKIILYYIPPYSDGSFNIDGTWYLTSKDESMRSLLMTGTEPNIEIVDTQDSTHTILTLETGTWANRGEYAQIDYPYSYWYRPVSYNDQNDPLVKNTSYYISGTAGSLTITSGNYTYKSDYYNGKQLSLNAVPYATKDLPGGIKIGDGLSINDWGECNLDIHPRDFTFQNYYGSKKLSLRSATASLTSSDSSLFNVNNLYLFRYGKIRILSGYISILDSLSTGQNYSVCSALSTLDRPTVGTAVYCRLNRSTSQLGNAIDGIISGNDGVFRIHPNSAISTSTDTNANIININATWFVS